MVCFRGFGSDRLACGDCGGCVVCGGGWFRFFRVVHFAGCGLGCILDDLDLLYFLVFCGRYNTGAFWFGVFGSS